MTSLFLKPLTAAQCKYPETILTFDREALRPLPIKEGFTPQSEISLKAFIDSVWLAHCWRVRQDVDEKVNWGESYKGNRNVSQWLNYCTLEQSDERILPYMRSRDGGGESDLKGRGSIGAGGHTDFVDAVHDNSIIDLCGTAILNLARELWEECQFVKDGEKITLQTLQIEDHVDANRIADGITTLQQAVDFLYALGTLYHEGYLFDNSDNVGRLHMGVCWRLKLHQGITAVSREKGVDYIDPFYPSEVYTAYPNVTFENWSKLYLEHLCGPKEARNSVAAIG